MAYIGFRLVTITYQLTDAPAVVTLDIQTNANTSAAANWNGRGDRPFWRRVVARQF